MYSPIVRFFFRNTSIGVNLSRYGEDLILRAEDENATLEFTSDCIQSETTNILQN